MVSLDVNDPRSGEDRRASLDTAGYPWWAKAIVTIGILPSMLAFVVYSIVVSFSEAQASTNHMLNEHVSTVPAMIKMLEDHERSDIRLENYLRLLCVQAAKTQAERNTCLSVR